MIPERCSRGRFYLSGFVLACFLILASAECVAQSRAATGIVFLHFRMSHGELTLLSSTVRPGRLKPAPVRDIPGGLFFSITAANGDTVYENAVDDPARRRLEYEDPDNPGRMRTVEMTTEDTRFTIRIPYVPEIRRITLYRNDAIPAGVNTRTAARVPITTFDLHLDGGGE